MNVASQGRSTITNDQASLPGGGEHIDVTESPGLVDGEREAAITQIVVQETNRDHPIIENPIGDGTNNVDLRVFDDDTAIGISWQVAELCHRQPHVSDAVVIDITNRRIGADNILHNTGNSLTQQ